MIYKIFFKPSALKELDKIPEVFARKILNKINELKNNPKPPKSKKLENIDGFRIRIGEYRVIYITDDSAKEIRIMAIGHRKDIYR